MSEIKIRKSDQLTTQEEELIKFLTEEIVEMTLKEYYDSKLKSGDTLSLEYIKAMMKDEKFDTGDLV